jgi:hypothetical protein
MERQQITCRECGQSFQSADDLDRHNNGFHGSMSSGQTGNRSGGSQAADSPDYLSAPGYLREGHSGSKGESRHGVSSEEEPSQDKADEGEEPGDDEEG